jgi:HK97 family phage major capsid protein
LSASRAEVSPRRVRLNELYAFVTATDEIVEDAPRLGTILTRQAARAILWQLNEAIFRGNGVGKPLGFLSAPSLVTVEQEAGQTADTITAPNVLKMYSRLAPGSSNRAVWLVHPSAIPQLYTMTIGSQPVFLPSNTSGLQEMSEFGLLCGRPIVPSDHCATLGDVGDIILADPMGYYLPVKQTGLQFASSMHVFFDYGIHAFRWTIRVGGQPHLSAPISPANGNATKSHFIVLEERAGS